MNHARACLDGIFSMEADFTHEIIHRLGNRGATMSGQVQLRRGGRMRLEYSDPEGHLLISDGVNLQSYNPSTKTVIQGSARTDSVISAFDFVLDGGEAKAFDVSFLGGAATPKDGASGVISLVPKKHNPLVARVLVTMSPTCPPVKRVTIVDRAGTAIRITLENIRTNVGLGKARFQFTPPRGAKVVRP